MGICYLVGAMGGDILPILEKEDCLMAVDGGLSTIQGWGLTPDVVVGDFDSLGYTPTGENVTLLPVEKDHTDMGYALKLGKEREYTSFFMQGGLGGRMDHTLGNYQLLLGLSKTGCRGILAGEQQNITVITQESIQFPPTMEGYCSVFSLEGTAEGVTLEGLAYTLENATLTSHFPLGVSNQFLPGESGKISVKQGSLAVIWHGKYPLDHYKSLLNNK